MTYSIEEKRSFRVLTEATVDHLLDGVSGVGDVGDGVPGHCEELQNAEQNGQPFLVPPKCRTKRQDPETNYFSYFFNAFNSRNEMLRNTMLRNLR